MQTQVYSIDEIREIVAPIAKQHGVDKVFLFGSYARGDATPASDVDLCVDAPKLRGLFALGGLYADLEDALKKSSGLSVPRPLFGRWKSVGAIRVDDTFSLAWRVLAAEYWGVAQRRHRIFLVADFAGVSAEKILFDYCGVSRNPAPGGGTWQAVAEGVRHCFADTSWLDWLDKWQREKESK